tara:strand:- start:226 stop:1125 length:900 start_codon:yes stop_codon:yes gene_type:complete
MASRNISFNIPSKPFVPNYNEEQKDTLILVPTGLGVDHKTDEQLRKLESFGYQVWRQPGYSAIDQCRNKMIYNFLTHTQFKNILWIDGDIIFTLEDVQKLEQSEFDIVGGTYPFKGHPQLTFVPIDDEQITFGESGHRFIEVEALATGFLFITRKSIIDIIDKLGIPLCNTSFDNPSYPLFTPDVISGDTYVGEDFGFCAKAKKCGYKLYLDTTIHLKHVGRYEYSWSDVVYKIPEKTELNYNIKQSQNIELKQEVQTKTLSISREVFANTEDVYYNKSKGNKRGLLSFITSIFKRLFG